MNEETARVLTAAIAAAGPMGNDVRAWRDRVMVAIAPVAVMFEDESREAQRVENMLHKSRAYTGLLVSVTKEESSNRLVVRTDSERTKDGERVFEEIRTDVLNTPTGAAMQRTLQRFKPGDRLLLWRVNEPMRSDPQKNVRTLYHVMRIGLAEVPDPPPPSANPAPDRPTATQQPPPSPGGGAIPVSELLRQLNPAMKGRVAARAREKMGSVNMMKLTADQEMDLLAIIIDEQNKAAE